MALQRRTNVPTDVDGGSTSGTITLTRPSDAATGDMIIAFLSTAEAAATSISANQGGWSDAIPYFTSSTAGGQAGVAMYRTATGGDPASWTFQINGGSSANYQYACAIAACYDDNGGTPVFGSGSSGEDTSGPAVTSGSHTPGVANCLVYDFMFNDESSGTPTWTVTTPASSGNTLAEIADTCGGSSHCISVNVELQTSATATTHTSTKSVGTRGGGWGIFSIQPGTAPAGATAKQLAALGVG